MKKLLVDITAHGFGHLAQTAPVINKLQHSLPGLEIVVRSGLTASVLATKINGPFRVVTSDNEFGVVMASPFQIDRRATIERYSILHDQYETVVNEVASWILKERFDAVLSNISYLVVDAASRVDTPALAVSSLNWHDVLRHYCTGHDGVNDICGQMHSAYSRAATFVRLVPGMPMPDFNTVTMNAIIAQTGTPHQEELRRRFGVGEGSKIIVFALGSMSDVDPPDWNGDLIQDHILFGPASWARHSPWQNPATSGVSFTDLLASADIVLSKPGYGIVTEAAAAGTPVILLARDAWPEEPFLIDWLTRHGKCIYLDRLLDSFMPEELFDYYDALAAAPSPPLPATGGEDQVAALMESLLREGT